jgi:hypothetical protein
MQNVHIIICSGYDQCRFGCFGKVLTSTVPVGSLPRDTMLYCRIIVLGETLANISWRSGRSSSDSGCSGIHPDPNEADIRSFIS